MHQPTRRQFLRTASASAAATTLAPSVVAADRRVSPTARITIGVVGLGSRGFNLIDSFLGAADAQIVAICDVDRHHHRDRPWGTGTAFGREPAKQKISTAYAKKKSGRPAKGLQVCSDFRQLVNSEDIDAVVVATPDHWHAHVTLAAIEAGKDVYCEKPVTHLFGEGQTVYRAVKEKGAVFQTGSQQRSDAKFRRTAELARNGLLGKIHRVEVGLPPGYDKPQGDTKVIDPPEQLDYDFWCGPSPQLPYMCARHHRWWRGHRAYGGGVLMDWIGHHNDIAHWALGMDASGPQEVTAVEWSFPETDVYDTPHHYTIACRYAGGIESSISSRNPQGLKLIGEEGWVYVRRGHLQASRSEWVDPKFDPGQLKVYRSDDHVQNFLDCVGSRQSCIAPAETAHRSITPGHLGYVSQAVGRTLRWDPKRETILGDSDADRLLRNVRYRQPW